MGTSTSHRSPDTPNWHAAQAAYVNSSVPVERAVQEIWRAATNQSEGDISQQLANPIIAQCLSIAATAQSRTEALTEVSRHVALSGQASLGTEIAQRAVVLSFREGGDRVTAYASSLFSEASDYLVSRDLPGFVGEAGRAKNVSEALTFKAGIRRIVTDVVAAVPRPTLDASGPAWSTFVLEVVDRLRGRTSKSQ